MRMKEESEKVGLKLNIQKTKIMASGPITSWQIDGETVERRPQGAVSHEVRRRGQLASRGAPGKSGLHASGEGERVVLNNLFIKEK